MYFTKLSIDWYGLFWGEACELDIRKLAQEKDFVGNKSGAIFGVISLVFFGERNALEAIKGVV